MVFGVSNASPVSGDKELDAKPVEIRSWMQNR